MDRTGFSPEDTPNILGRLALIAGLVALLAASAYAGGRPAAQGTTLKTIKAKAASGRAASRGPSANVGQTINLVGSEFDENVSVEFVAFVGSSFSILPLEVKNRRVTVAVPVDTVTGSVRLIDPETGRSQPMTLQIVPSISALSSQTVTEGQRLLIDGTGFSSSTRVQFRGLDEPVAPTIVSPTRIDLIVPAGARSGKMTVITDGGQSKAQKIKVMSEGEEAARVPEPAPRPRGRTVPRAASASRPRS